MSILSRAPDATTEPDRQAPCACRQIHPGTLFLVVGPSGAGKDTIIDAARVALAACPCFVFPRRLITRAAGDPGEDHIAVSQDEFDRRVTTGDICLHWSAHGLSYGIPTTLAHEIEAGRHGVINVSRRLVAPARARFARVHTIIVTAAPDILAARLAARGREDAAAIAERLARAPGPAIDGPDVSVLRNEASPAEGLARFLAILADQVPGCAALAPSTRLEES